MKPLLLAGMILLIGAAGVFSSSVQEKEAEFFAGVLLLQSTTVLTPEQKAEKYKELQMMTGITTADAKAILNDYRKKPTEWQNLYSIMTKLLNDQKPSPLTPDKESKSHH
jgi:hypothetical protein